MTMPIYLSLIFLANERREGNVEISSVNNITHVE